MSEDLVQRTQLRKFGTIAFQSGGTVRQRISVTGMVRRIMLDLTGTLTVSDNTSAYAIAHNPLTLIRNITVWVNEDLPVKVGSGLDFKRRALLFSKVNTEVPVVATNAAYAIRAKIPIYFTPPRLVGNRFPTDSVLNMDPAKGGFKTLDIEIQWGTTANLLNGGASSFTTAPAIDVLMDVSRWDNPPTFLFKEMSIDSRALSTTANTELELPLQVGSKREYHHLVLVAEDVVANTGRTLVSTALNSVELKQEKSGALSNIIGPITGHQLQHEFDELFTPLGGMQTGLYPIVFQGRYDGMVNYNLDATDLDSLLFKINHDAFSTNGYFRILQGVMERIR